MNENINSTMEKAETPKKSKKKTLLINLVTFVVTLGILLGVFFVLKGDITMAEYNQIKEGMTYDEVCDIIGAEGELGADSSFGGYSAEVYTWKGTLYFISGANASISFMNGKVTAKAQVGLI